MNLQTSIKLTPLAVIIYILIQSTCCSYLEDQKKEVGILKRILENYDTDIRPPSLYNDGRPVQVNIDVFVRNIDRIDDVNMEFTTQLTFRQYWVDPRLQYEDPDGKIQFIHIKNPTRIWKPDLFFSNKIEGKLHLLLEPNMLIRLYPNGTIMFSSRITLRLLCPMDLQRYPHDQQRCYIIMTSYGYTTNDVVFTWKNSNTLTIKQATQLPTFTMERYETGYCHSTTSTGTYSCLRLDMFFTREFSSYFREIYVPTSMMVFVAWLSLWLHPAALTCRAVMVSTAMLATFIGSTQFRHSEVQTAYSKPVDHWIGICMTFIFSALAEMVIANHFFRKEQQQERHKWLMNKKKSKAGKDDNDSCKELLDATITGDNEEGTIQFSMNVVEPQDGQTSSGSTTLSHLPTAQLPFWRRWLATITTLPPSERLDSFYRIGYLFLFGLFQLCYWAKYLP